MHSFTRARKNCFEIVVIILVNKNFMVLGEQYAAPILVGGGGDSLSSFHSSRPGPNIGDRDGHYHSPGYPMTINLQDSSSSSSSSFSGSGFPPSGESYPPPQQQRPPGPGLDYDQSDHNSHNIAVTSNSVSGDYCWQPLFNFCDTPRTILYCIDNRCTCPTGWTLSPGNVPLNTVWDPSSRRCLSVVGSGCHTHASSHSSIGNGYVYCQPSIQCIPLPNFRDVGTCGARSLLSIHLALLLSFSFTILFLFNL